MSDLTKLPIPKRRWLKRALWSVAWIVTIFALAVAIENRLGARAWQSALAEAHAAGEPTDPAQLIPAPALDEDNFAASPFFKPLLEYESTLPTPDEPMGEVRWRDPAGEQRLEALELPRIGNQNSNGGFIDLSVYQKALSPSDSESPPAVSVLRGLARFDPDLALLREAAHRPRARFPFDGPVHGPGSDHYPVVLLHLARIVQMRAVAELSLNRTEEGWQDLQLGIDLAEATREEPLLLAQMVRVACWNMVTQALWEGLARHQWNEEQLAQMDSLLRRPDFAVAFQRGVRGERDFFLIPAMDRIKENGEWFYLLNGGPNPLPKSTRAALHLLPTGWVDFNKAALFRALTDLVRAADPMKRQFRLAEAARVTTKMATSGFNPRKCLALQAFYKMVPALSAFAATQSRLDMAGVAVALERYRLAHGEWPESLDALSPGYLAQIPNDVVGDGPLHYHRGEHGGFTLYSVGINGRDDGGKDDDVAWPPYPAP